MNLIDTSINIITNINEKNDMTQITMIATVIIMTMQLNLQNTMIVIMIITINFLSEILIQCDTSNIINLIYLVLSDWFLSLQQSYQLYTLVMNNNQHRDDVNRNSIKAIHHNHLTAFTTVLNLISIYI